MSIFKKIKDWLRKPLAKNEKIISPLGVSLPDRPSSSRLSVKKCRNSKPMRKAVEDTNTAFPFNTNTAFPFNINPLYPNSMLSGRHTTRSRTEDLDDTTTRNNSSSGSCSSSSSSCSSSSDSSSSYSSSSDSSSSSW